MATTTETPSALEIALTTHGIDRHSSTGAAFIEGWSEARMGLAFDNPYGHPERNAGYSTGYAACKSAGVAQPAPESRTRIWLDSFHAAIKGAAMDESGRPPDQVIQRALQLADAAVFQIERRIRQQAEGKII